MQALTFKIGNHQLLCNGDCGYTVLFETPPSKQLTKQILSLKSAIEKQLKSSVKDIIPSYQSLTILFDPGQNARKDLVNNLESILASSIKFTQFDTNRIEIPVCYETKYAPDLDRLAKHCNLTNEEVIKKHTASIYWIAMLGFLPGFVYLSGLEDSLHCPRKTVPDLLVPEGSIAIGGGQTGLYSLASPGGWNVIGTTPSKLLSFESEHPIKYNPLDEIQFVAIDEQTFLEIQDRAGES